MQAAGRSVARLAVALFRLLASLKLAVLLIVALAGVLAWATLLESAKGRECALWSVYHSSWFAALLALLAVNLLAAALIRFPWKLRHTGFLLAHAGLLVLLAGALQTFCTGIEGQLSFHEGETANVLLLNDRSQFTVFRQGQHGAKGQLPDAFIFRPGPVDWPDGKTLDLGEFNGVALKVLKFYRHARVEQHWVKDEAAHGGPALRLSLVGPDGQSASEEWLAVDQLAAPVMVGAAKVELLRAPVDSMQEDFLKPPTRDGMDPSGVLSVHYQGHMVRIPVSENVGKKVPVGDSHVAVEIAEYLPAAKPSSSGKFVSEGKEPKNPLLDLRVHLPGKDQPLRQIAFARIPLLNLDGIHGWNCPVKFWYHHAALTPEPGVEFLQTPDGKLCCRAASEGNYEPRATVKQGDQIDIPQKLKISVLDYLPSARREVSFSPIELATGDAAGPEAAALVEVTAGGTTKQVWLQRNDPEYGGELLAMADNRLGLMFGYERLPLGFSLQLRQFQRGMNPGRMGDASFASSVRLVDQARGIDQQREIAMNQPLVHGRFTFYQSSFEDRPGEGKASVLSVSYDPGRFLKYSGSVMICLGILMMYCMKASPLKRFPFFGLWRQSRAAGGVAADHGTYSNPPLLHSPAEHDLQRAAQQ